MPSPPAAKTTLGVFIAHFFAFSVNSGDPLAFRASGPYIANELTKEPKAIVYLFDAVFSFNPLNYVSNMFLSTAVYNRFFFPQLHVLSKCDLLPPEEANRIVEWSADPEALEVVIDEKLSGTRRLLSIDMMHAIYRLGLQF
ncbi:unnamed protein product, partial [marine sediment metagenome]